jgi:hypothetical protein
MQQIPSVAERLDHALDRLGAGARPGVAAATAGLAADGRALVETAERLREALPVPPVASRFEARLGAQLSGATSRDPVAWAFRHPGRLLVTGAVGSAVGVGVTAYAVWRSSRRPRTGRVRRS